MIRRLSILFLFLGPAILFAQQSTLLSGSISNGEIETLGLSADPLYLISSNTQSVKTENGKFKFELKLSEPMAVTLAVGDRKIPLFLIPGENIGMSIDLGQEGAKAIGFAGKGADYNLFLQQFQAEHALFDVSASNEKLLNISVDMLELDLFDQENKMKKGLDIAFKDASYPQSFRDYLRSEVDYAYDRWLLAYPIERANANPKLLQVKHLPRIIQEGFDEKRLSNSSALISQVYRDYVWYYMIYFTSEQNGYAKFTDYNKSLNAKFDYASTHLEGKVLTWYVSRLMAENCDKVAPGTIDRLKAGIKKSDGAATYLKKVDEICKEAQAGQIADASTDGKKVKKNKTRKSNSKMSEEKYKFKMVSLEGKEMHLSDFKGKVVYIDYWASWCGPCRQQMPFSKKLHHKIEDELGKKVADDIVFLYISIDQDEAAWRKGIEAMSIEGAHGFSNARWPDGAGNFFQIPGIPRYMIMDKEGEIVDMNAPRPSMPGIFDLLKDLQEK
jgi:thiol-disulfide isomerase/thioredoxin